MGYVAAEIRNPRTNILRGLLIGTVALALVYLLVNIAFLRALGFEGLRSSEAIAADVLRIRFGDFGARAISLLICLSCLGAINGMVFTGSRIYYAMGTEHRLFSWIGKWSDQFDTPARSLMLQAVVALALVVGFGPDRGAFERLVIFTTPVFWFFFLLVGLSLFVLRHKDPDAPRTFRVVFYPLTPILFCLSCLFMLYASVSWGYRNSSFEVLWSLLILAAGVLVSLYDPDHENRSRAIS